MAKKRKKLLDLKPIQIDDLVNIKKFLELLEEFDESQNTTWYIAKTGKDIGFNLGTYNNIPIEALSNPAKYIFRRFIEQKIEWFRDKRYQEDAAEIRKFLEAEKRRKREENAKKRELDLYIKLHKKYKNKVLKNS